MKKKCSKCLKLKPKSNFNYRKDTKDKLRTLCINCESDYQHNLKKMKLNTSSDSNKTCSVAGCNTIISIYNSKNKCWLHQREFSVSCENYQIV